MHVFKGYIYIKLGLGNIDHFGTGGFLLEGVLTSFERLNMQVYTQEKKQSDKLKLELNAEFKNNITNFLRHKS